MAIPVYTAVDFSDELIGGSSYPFIVMVMNEEGEYIEQPYVVKVFKQRNIEQYQPTNKEFYANALAKAFDIKVPNAALIYVGEDMIENLKKQEKYANFDLLAGYYYGSEYFKNNALYDKSKLKDLEEWGADNIFAFDTLIVNVDRRTRKPNILIVDEEYYLIDHELTLNVVKPCNFYMDIEHLEARWGFFIKKDIGKQGEHIFYKVLKEHHSKDQITFDEFEGNLRDIDLGGIIASVAEELREREIDVSDAAKIIEYLDCIKENRTDFINLLKALLEWS